MLTLGHNSKFTFSPSYKKGLEVRGWGLLIMSHANRLIEMTTSHCSRVLCSHLHSSEQILVICRVQSTLLLLDMNQKCSIFAFILKHFWLCRVKPRQDSWLFSLTMIFIQSLLMCCVGVQNYCHFIDYRTFQVCFCFCLNWARRSIEPRFSLKHCFWSSVMLSFKSIHK